MVREGIIVGAIEPAVDPRVIAFVCFFFVLFSHTQLISRHTMSYYVMRVCISITLHYDHHQNDMCTNRTLIATPLITLHFKSKTRNQSVVNRCHRRRHRYRDEDDRWRLSS